MLLTDYAGGYSNVEAFGPVSDDAGRWWILPGRGARREGGEVQNNWVTISRCHLKMGF
jgi:hypothetical protein